MTLMTHSLALLFPLVLFVACKPSSRHSTFARSPSEQNATSNFAKATIAACSLVTIEEMGAIQGATITEAKGSVSPSGKLIMSQCYYNSKEPNMAISLAVIQPSAQSSSGSEARDYWADSFGHVGHESAGGGEESEKKGEENERRIPPKKIDGIGEEAYWSGNRFGGALYVLKNNVIVRVSVGGPGSEEDKISKSKAITQKAIERL